MSHHIQLTKGGNIMLWFMPAQILNTDSLKPVLLLMLGKGYLFVVKVHSPLHYLRW